MEKMLYETDTISRTKRFFAVRSQKRQMVDLKNTRTFVRENVLACPFV